MRILVINLDRATERWEWMQAGLARLGLSAERLPAVDGHALPAAERAAHMAKAPPDRPLSPGELGCLLSHREAWRRIAAGEARWACVLEDDLHLASAATSFLRDGSWVPPGVALVKLETSCQLVRLGRRIHAAPGGHVLRRLLSSHMGTGGYVVTREGAGQLLALTEGRCTVVDHLLFCPREGLGPWLPAWQLWPAILVQEREAGGRTGLAFLASQLDRERQDPRLMMRPRPTPPDPRPGMAARLRRETRRLARQFLWLLRGAHPTIRHRRKRLQAVLVPLARDD